MKKWAGSNESIGGVFIREKVEGVEFKEAFFRMRSRIRVQPKINEFGIGFMMKIKVEC